MLEVRWKHKMQKPTGVGLQGEVDRYLLLWVSDTKYSDDVANVSKSFRITVSSLTSCFLFFFEQVHASETKRTEDFRRLVEK